MNEEIKTSVHISDDAHLLSIDIVDGPIIPTLTRDEAYALYQAIGGALSQMAQKLP